MSGIIGGAGSKSGVIGETELEYEEGTFNAGLSVGSGSATVDSSWNQLRYTRVGRTVFVQGQFRISAVSGPSGYTRITGLPYNVPAGTEYDAYSSDAEMANHLQADSYIMIGGHYSV